MRDKNVPSASPNKETDGHWNNYFEYSKTLRAWLVAYGVGGPVLLATNAEFSKRLIASGGAMTVINYFLLGVAFQVALAFVNKWCSYHQYLAHADKNHRQKISYKIWDFINDYWHIDFLLDFLSVLAFAWATLQVLQVYMGT